MDNPIEEIKKRIDIVEFIGNFVNLKKAGRNYKALCPFHNEKTPSFIVSPERQIWHCFGACNEGGDVIKFLMKWENITFYEALKELAQKTGVVLRKLSFEDKIWKRKERFLNMNFWAAEFFSYVLHQKKYGEKAIAYLKSRKIDNSTIKAFQLGYSPNSWDSLKKFLMKKKFSEEEMFENGLVVRDKKGMYYDRFRGRLIFPIKDSRGFILGFSGRVLDEKIKEAKYINSPETLVYKKRETLFGINLAKEAIKEAKNAYIVEGEFDVISPYQYGFRNFVAIKGTALTNEQLLLLKRYTDKITLALDVDEAGIESTKRAIEEAERLDFEIRIVSLSSGKDPDEAIKNDINTFKKDIKKSFLIYDFIIEMAQKKYPENTPIDKKKIAYFVLPFIEKIVNPIVKSYYVKKIAKELDTSEQTVEKMLMLMKKKKNEEQLLKRKIIFKNKEKRELLIEKYLLSLIFQNEDPYKISDEVFRILNENDFSHLSFRKIIKIFLEDKINNTKFNLERFLKKLPEEIKPVFDEIYLFASIDESFSEKNIKKLSLEIKRNSLKRNIKEILESNINEEEDRSKLIELNNKLKEVEKLISS